MSALPAQALAAAALANPDALDDLARAWLPLVYQWCHRLGGPTVDAEDAAHEALIVMCRRIRNVRSPEVFPSWLYSVTRRVIANHRRRAWVRRWVPGIPKDAPTTQWGPDRTAEARQAAEQVHGALDGLSSSHRDVLVLCSLEERSASEAAALLGIPVGTVKSRLRSARTAFRAALEQQDPQMLAARTAEVG